MSDYAKLMKQAELFLEAADRIATEAADRKAVTEAVGPEPEEGSVVVFKKRFSDSSNATIYVFAAIRIAARWYITQSSQYPAKSPLTWDSLLEFAGLYNDRNEDFLFAASWVGIDSE